MDRLPYEMEYVGSYSATLAPPEIVNAPPGDMRVNFFVTGGEVWGPKMKGKLRPLGADWLTLRTDGVAVLDVRAGIETDDGALIDVTYNGLIDLGEDGHAAFLRGEVPDRVKIHAAPRMRTAHPAYQWINRAQFINIGEGFLKQGKVRYDVYVLR